MITSEQIQGRIGGFPGGQGQRMPTIYGQHATRGFNHGEQDPYGYGMVSQAAGTMVGATGVSVMGGAIGATMAFGGAFRAIPRVWGGLKEAGAAAQAPWAAGQYGMAARTFGWGVGRAAWMGAKTFLPAYLGYKVLSHVGSSMYQGARFQQDANRVMAQHLRFQTQSQSRTGFGLSERQMRGVTRMIDSMTDKDTLRTRSELMRVMDKLGQRDFFQDTTNVNQFRKKFKSLVKTLKHMAQTFGTSLEEAVPLLDTMRRSGIHDSQAQKAMALRIRTAGLDPGAAMGLMQQAAGMGRASGGHGGAAAQGALSIMRQLSFMQQMGGGVGTRVSNLMTEITGGQTGQAAAASTAQQMSALTLRFLRSPLGRMALAGMSNRKMTGMDAGVMEQLMSGDLSLGQLRRQGFSNTASMGSKARFINREGDLRTAFLKQGGATAMAALVQSALRSHFIQGTSNRDIQEIIMQRFTGGNRRMAQLLMTMMKNLPQMRRDMFRAELRQGDLRYRAAMGRDRWSFAAMGRRIKHGLHSALVRPFSNIGQDMYRGIKTWGMDLMDRISGTTSVNLSEGGASAAVDFLSGDQTAARRMDYHFGSVGQHQELVGMDLQRRSTFLNRRGGGPIVQDARNLLRYITGAGKRREDLGTQLHGMFGNATLRAFGGQIGSIKDRGNRAVLYRVNRSGQLQERGQDSSNTTAMMMSASQMNRILTLEKRRASGARGADVIKQNLQHTSTIKAAAMRIRQKILASPEIMARLRNASPSERRQIMRTEFKKAAKGIAGMDSLVSGIANRKYGDLGGSNSAAGRQQAWDDVMAGAELVNERVGIHSQAAYANGDPADKFESAKDAKAATESAISKIGNLARDTGFGAAFRYFTGRDTETTQWVKQSDIFRSRTDLSEAIMKHSAGMSGEMSESQKLIISRIQSHRGGSMTIGGKTYDESTINRLKNVVSRASTARTVDSAWNRKHRFGRDSYLEWVGGLQKRNLIAASTQVQSFGAHMATQLKGVRGPLGERLQKLFGRLQNMEASRGAFQKLHDQNEFGGIARDFSKMKQKARTEFLADLARRGKGGAMLSSALRTYIQTKGKEADKMRAASKAFYGLAVGGGSVTVGSKRANLKDALAIWNDYVRVNQQFVQAVGSVLGGKLKTAAASLRKVQRTATQGA